MNTSGSSGLLQILIYLAAMVVTVPLFKKLGLGAVLGYLAAGVVLGPQVTGLLQESQESALHFSEFGVIMMLFLIGLELNPKVLWKLRMPIFGLGGLQVLLTTSALLVMGISAGYPWQISLAVGMILSMSSTAIALQTLQEKGLLKSPAGENSFSVLLFQDVAVIPILAVFPLLATAAPSVNHGSSWAKGALILGAVSIVVLGGRFLFRPFFRIIARSRLRELFTATALLLVLSITALMQAVGLSPALGAFLAGVVLADSEYRHQIESDIEPFKGILLGVFFISVGSGIDFSLFQQMPFLMVGIICGLILLKFLIVFGLGRSGKMQFSDSLLFGITLAQGGEFAFVLLTMGGDLKIFSPEQQQLLTAVVALSMAMAPLLMNAYLRWGEPYFSQCALGNEREADRIDEKNNPVILVGIGRFGQAIMRLLKASGFRCTVLDYDADQVDVLRKFGTKAYFGDASRLDLLHSAGAAQAQILALALDDKEKTIELIKIAHEHFPHLKIFVRAYDRVHAYEIINMGVDDVYVETAGSAFQVGGDILKSLGFRAHRAHRAMQIFKKHNEASIRHLAKIYKESDEANFISQAKFSIEALEKIFETDVLENTVITDHAWSSAPRSEDQQEFINV